MKRASWTRRATRVALVTIAVASAAAACGRHDDRNVDSAGGAALPSDTGALRATGATMAVGPLIYVTKTDDKSVHDATQLQLTEQRMKQFMAAAESLNALRGRDTRVQQLEHTNLQDAGSTDLNAGLKLLESDTGITRAVQSAGLSVRDYYVTGITIANAMHYTQDPKAAPPTPSAEANAKLLRAHQADLQRIAVIDQGGVVVTPSSSPDTAKHDTTARH